MKKRIKSLLVAIMSLAIIVSGILGSGVNDVAAATEPIRLTDGTEFVVKPGEVNEIKLSVVATSVYIYEPLITISGGEDAPFTFSKPKMYIGTAEVQNIGTGMSTDMIFDVTVSDTAKIGTYPITIKLEYNDALTDIEVTTYVYTKLKITDEKVPAQMTIGNVGLSESSKGSNSELNFSVRNEGGILAKNAYLTLDFGEGIEERYTVKNIRLGDMNPGEIKDLTLPITIMPTAATGRKTVKATFTYKNSDGSEEFKPTYDFSFNITDAVNVAKVPKLIIKDMNYGSNLQPGDDFTLSVSLENIGGAEATDISAAIDASSISEKGIIKNYFMDSIAVDDIKKNTDASVKIPLKVSKGSTGGLLPVKLVVAYKDNADASYSFNETVYVDVAATASETDKPNLIISNVAQSSSKPVAGDKVELSFDLENKSNVDAKELMISVDGLTEATFIPVNPDPYQYFEKLKGGDKIRVTIPLVISNQIPAGLNNVKIKIAYNGSESVEAFIPVKNIQNDSAGISKPVLLISNYSTDVEELKAGTTFNLTFDIYNTNATTAAKNIKVTIKKSTDPNSDVFNLTQGNNSFFINKLNPEESVTKTLQMKVKSNASTQAYPVILQVEYEYDGLKPDPETGDIKGIEMTTDLNLQVIENARPVVDNANIYSWEGPVSVGTPATLHLDFYNMGRSQLNNVTVTVEGDFSKADGSMYFIGNTAAGSSAYADFDVIPNLVGSAKCILKVNYEDSNGDLQEYIHEFTTDVMDAASMPMPGDMGENPGGEVFNPGGVMPKKNIVPMWAFILIQCAIFVLFVPITRKVIISIYKAKLLKKEQEKY
jgi:hypothetical protein